MIRKISSILILLTIWIIPLINVNAKTINDMENELAQLQKSYNVAKSKVNMTQAELNKVKANIASTEEEIKNTQNEITKAENDIQKSEKSIEEKKEQINQMLLYLQLSGEEKSFINYLVEADDYTEFIYRYSVVTQLSNYNKKLMNKLTELIETLQNSKTELAKKQEELERKNTELQSQYAIIQVQYKNDQDSGLGLADQIEAKKKEIKVAIKRCDGNKNININSCSGAASVVDGWTYPLKKFYQSSPYAELRESGKHYAVDLSISEGNNVYAVANGEVIYSDLANNNPETKIPICNNNSDSKKNSSLLPSPSYNCHCGGYIIQIRHELLDGSYYVSLYMHLLESYVEVGDVVTKGQVIGLSGGGRQEAEKWTDQCTEGAHLHFSMSYGSNLIEKSNILGNTFNPIKFFPAMTGKGAKY